MSESSPSSSWLARIAIGLIGVALGLALGLGVASIGNRPLAAIAAERDQLKALSEEQEQKLRRSAKSHEHVGKRLAEIQDMVVKAQRGEEEVAAAHAREREEAADRIKDLEGQLREAKAAAAKPVIAENPFAPRRRPPPEDDDSATFYVEQRPPAPKRAMLSPAIAKGAGPIDMLESQPGKPAARPPAKPAKRPAAKGRLDPLN